MLSTIRWIRLLIIAGGVALFVSYLGVWQRMISDRAERTGADFIHFYSAGRIAQIYGSDRVYDLALQRGIEQEQVGFALAQDQVLPYNHLPFLIPALKTIMTADYVSSFYRWALLMIVVYTLGLSFLIKGWTEAEMQPQSMGLVAVAGLLFLPFFVSLMNGQDTALLFLGAALWTYGLQSKKPVLSGLGLSLTTIRPHIALLLALPMVFYNRRVVLGFVIGAGSLALLSFLLLGAQGTREFIDVLLLSAGGELYGVKPEAMFNLIGMLTRLFPSLGAATIRVVGWILYGLTIVWLCILWGRNKDLHVGIFGLTIALGLFVAPHLYLHDLAILLIAIFELIKKSSGAANTKIGTAIAAPIAISLLLLASNIAPILQYSVPYLLMAGLAIYPYFPRLRSALTTPHRS